MLPQFGILTVIFLNIWAIKVKRRSFLTSFWAGLIFALGISTIIEPAWLRGWLASIIQDINTNDGYSSLLSQLLGTDYASALWVNLVAHLGLLLLLMASSSAFTFQNEEGMAWMLSLIMVINSMVAFPALPGIQILCTPAIIMVIGTWMARRGAFSKTFFWVMVVLLLILPWFSGDFQSFSQSWFFIRRIRFVGPVLDPMVDDTTEILESAVSMTPGYADRRMHPENCAILTYLKSIVQVK